ncbi:MAG: VTC domain-containing protein, partial [Bacteroidales bacterium]|nr:VTC domain-containing protein [Bacteroidales bacterium]
MLKWHQNGKLNRYKIRKRKYVLTGDTFLEVKFKSNKGKTAKYRRLNGVDFEKDKDFIMYKTPFCWLELTNVLNNKFERMMLVNKNNQERVSIDLNVGFSNGDDAYQYLDRLVILEIKSERHVGITELQRSLKFLHIHPSGFSKYITGMYMYHKELKFNRFKNRFRNVNKVLEKNIL